ncbi:MAG: ribonuclease P protein component 1 [Haloarculaceae archaeon]
MPLTRQTLPRHELVGLPAEVVSASNPDLVGIAGDVVAETTKTLGIERQAGGEDRRDGSSESGTEPAGESRVATVPKAGATFAFALPDGPTVRVEGDRLLARPARRTEQTGDSQWR